MSFDEFGKRTADARDEPVWLCPDCKCLNADHEAFCYRCGALDEDEDEDELADFDPTQEGGGGPCERCGYVQEPWRYSRLCQACIWDMNSDASRGTDRSE